MKMTDEEQCNKNKQKQQNVTVKTVNKHYVINVKSSKSETETRKGGQRGG